eukprot:CAMPEP_0203746106 /NCGR_PEP_ID=MMETSP0098-20131031/1643_1 /ASSEMBLY_ACC=CAM_ASM_000208 /TAXON_ID=96639 /ORGANISM=" , Strain NY0313808BC1" /LENGTH=546 /DNA_ID=CAMNT_0050634079 /DNA_START=518 /DNA_END=2158 /DNA_ORIENTATION=+
MNSPEDIWVMGDNLEKLYAGLPKQLPAEGEYDISKHLAGPLNDKKKFPRGWLDAIAYSMQWQKKGLVHVNYAQWQEEYGDRGLASNIVVPYIIFKRSDGDEGTRLPPVITHEVIIGDPEDARRIGRVHVKKQPNFNLFFFGSVISTVDNDYWKMQREQLVPAFLPKASLEQIFQISSQRARVCAQRLRDLSDNGEKVVDMNEFLLFETQAQLQLALFGETEEFMEATNEKFRHAMGGSYDPGFVRPFCKELAQRMERDDRTLPAIPQDLAAGKCPMAKGPLSAVLRRMEGVAPRTREGNSLIFAFAGHDTTGHTMSWLLFELSRHPDIQRRLQAEVDDFFKQVGDRPLVYEDWQKLPFMTRCIMETLRLWPAVANGTFREIQFDDYINGPDGKQVLIKKGTYVRLVNWSRHRNPDLWGPDANEFNPDREFRGSEIWNGDVLKAYNPATERFSPFAFPPRGCIGMNFAHLEARGILAFLLRDFDFSLPDDIAKSVAAAGDENLGVNYGTLGPRDFSKPEFVEGYAGWAPTIKIPMGLPMKVIPRKRS